MDAPSPVAVATRATLHRWIAKFNMADGVLEGEFLPLVLDYCQRLVPGKSLLEALLTCLVAHGLEHQYNLQAFLSIELATDSRDRSLPLRH